MKKIILIILSVSIMIVEAIADINPNYKQQFKPRLRKAKVVKK